VDHTARFAALMRESAPDLDAVCTAIAQHRAPSLADDEIGIQLDELAYGYLHSTDDRTGASLCRYLFVDHGFSGNAAHYYDAANSYLDLVLDRRLGIPLSLSVLAIEVGRRVEVPLLAVGMPGHVLLRERDDPGSFHDPFAATVGLDFAECEELFHQMHGPATQFDVSMLAPTPTIQLTARMLNNLTHVYLHEPDLASLAWVLRLRTMIPGVEVDVVRQLGGVLSSLGHFWEAASVFEDLAERQPELADQHTSAAVRLRANSN